MGLKSTFNHMLIISGPRNDVIFASVKMKFKLNSDSEFHENKFIFKLRMGNYWSEIAYRFQDRSNCRLFDLLTSFFIPQ